VARRDAAGGDILIEDNKTAFKQMMNLLMETYQKQKPSADMLRLWWQKLEHHEIEVVCKSFDTWIDTKTYAPTPADILDLCRHKVTIQPRLNSPVNLESNRTHSAQVKEQLKDFGKQKNDSRKWARKILANPKANPDIAVRFAHEAIGSIGVME
jgi:hypothetical protein